MKRKSTFRKCKFGAEFFQNKKKTIYARQRIRQLTIMSLAYLKGMIFLRNLQEPGYRFQQWMDNAYPPIRVRKSSMRSESAREEFPVAYPSCIAPTRPIRIYESKCQEGNCRYCSEETISELRSTVYMIICGWCEEKHIGETMIPLRRRLDE